MWHAISVVMRCSHLQQRNQLPPHLPRHRNGPYVGFNFVLIQIHEDKVILREFDPLIPTLNTHDVGAGSFESLNQSCWKDGDKDAGPGQGIE